MIILDLFQCCLLFAPGSSVLSPILNDWSHSISKQLQPGLLQRICAMSWTGLLTLFKIPRRKRHKLWQHTDNYQWLTTVIRPLTLKCSRSSTFSLVTWLKRLRVKSCMFIDLPVCRNTLYAETMNRIGTGTVSSLLLRTKSFHMTTFPLLTIPLFSISSLCLRLMEV